jgi:HAD superfamily hydrolase (TIGR01662 family)
MGDHHQPLMNSTISRYKTMILEDKCLMIKGIVMDMDGTITKWNLDFLAARRKALQELDKLNLRTPEMSEQLSLYLILKKLKDELDTDRFTSLRRRFYDLLEDMEVKAANEVTLYPGAVETLRTLRARGLRIGLVTNNGHAGTEITLRRCQLATFFDAIVTRDDCEEMKPDGTPVRKLLTEMNVTPEEAILVGDGVIDIMAARAAGLRSAAVATGPFRSDSLIQAEPDYLLGSVNDLPLLIDQLDITSRGQC